ncbi:hypothetical protein N7495_002333 [Penicillium taxi]|uniref:uncharacterized protein n=1 Tax=Penicillium taxi TaxID=168475 RepID=UPI002544DCE3|nr:uncharacterized protein N7495_002333 [Penicillium taxi]KAJ5901805.1 hypothetical protein N7495_002333 [Penicillium taxi]
MDILTQRSILSHTIPPAFQSRDDINPTLMMSWWATAFSMLIIIVRLCGRYIRLERFFPEDKVMVLSMIPLSIRIILVHFVLVYGTNNVQTDGLTADQISKRAIGTATSPVTLDILTLKPSIWTAKLTVCEFLKRVTGKVWRRSVAIFLRFIHFFLASTLAVVVITTLAECLPFYHYWQVIPDPGSSCRSGYAQLIAMGTCDVITDLLLVAFPVPIILTSQMPLKRKLSLVILFCLSLILVAITCYRVPLVIRHGGAQPYRSLIASLDILAATAVSNIVVIGSFVRDRGAKKRKYKRNLGSASVTESLDQSHVRRNTVMQHQWGSDCDLAADVGIRIDPELFSSNKGSSSSHPPLAPPEPLLIARTGAIDPNWSFDQPKHRRSEETHVSDDTHVSTTCSLEVRVTPREYIRTSQPCEKPPNASSITPSHQASFSDVGGLLNQHQPDTHFFSPPNPLNPFVTSPLSMSTTTVIEAERPYRGRSSRNFLEDLGVWPRTPNAALNSRFASSAPPTATSPFMNLQSSTPNPPPRYRPPSDASLTFDVELQDVGGLLEGQNSRMRR